MAGETQIVASRGIEEDGRKETPEGFTETETQNVQDCQILIFLILFLTRFLFNLLCLISKLGLEERLNVFIEAVEFVLLVKATALSPLQKSFVNPSIKHANGAED